ncbi:MULTISPECIES: putative toxin-antitoxin system toxin component, PIN family [Meiothermus]|uniref:tRNA(fMet)-specific endonuclease VapC n=3 Tax=Meiothermus TaxID=65551 RepID=A0A399E2Z0_9DEIN|nr:MULTISPECIES: putative toxin-antitoxin system toxin component, PIN family [Meiothermus]GIW39005.1 MAG: PIN domain-containing protein [Meiothermus sp.]ADD28185.1 PilT protein domain protein [Meiothermus ruber DSM 1279]AWR86790.1 hypothetical protein Mtai_v1c15490 [Meiothermus taiwanensis WR-220]KIQ53793.1 twitching motility protein PilT [Meiothermus taiwanensis]KZK16826.1 twitching motility protein PilT [Meiothermus taiwanensis]
MKIVLDTNVLIAALLKKGKAYRLVVTFGLEKERFEIVTAIEQLNELKRVLREKFPGVLSPQEIGHFISLFRQAAILVRPTQGVKASPDPDDDIILAIAVASKADYLVSGDKNHLLQLKKINSTKIVSLSWLLKKIAPYGR